MLSKADGLISCREVPFLGLIMALELGQPARLQSLGWSAATVCSTSHLCSMHGLLPKCPRTGGRRSMKRKNRGYHKGYLLCFFSVTWACMHSNYLTSLIKWVGWSELLGSSDLGQSSRCQPDLKNVVGTFPRERRDPMKADTRSVPLSKCRERV